jgi:NAD(P)-dependent dehydrogenase (short-subunit alcohol dehydrogenase family)
MDATRFAGKVALVTGAGSGIGRATALRLASEGAKVAAAELSEEGGLETLRLIAETGAKAIFIPTDVSRAADTERMVKETVEAFGGLHILINNAGIYDGKDRKITEIDIDVFRRTLDINLKGMFLSAKYAMPAIVKSGGGAAVLLSSVGAVKGGGNTAYSTSKGGVVALTRALAGQYGRYGVRVNAILPGPIETPIHIGVREAAGLPPASGSGMDHVSMPMLPRWGQPEEVAALIAFLVSDDASFMTGADLLIDAGATTAR